MKRKTKFPYRITFSWACFLAFLLIMLPNMIWMGVPPKNDILQGNNPPMAWLGVVQTVAQIMMIATLCMFLPKDRGEGKFNHPIEYVGIVSLVGYYVCWVLYYLAVLNEPAIILLAIFPVLFFLCVALRMNNRIALIPLAVFGVLHIGITIYNFC